MHDYIVEKHPDKLEIFETCQKLGDLKTEHFWCYLKDKVAEDLYAEESTEFVGVFTAKQNGYKLADQTVPYPTDDELIELVSKQVTELGANGICVFKPEDLKKTKWQLLAEAYINGRA